MTKHVSDHGITLDEKSQEQPADKDRAQAVNETDPSKKLPRFPENRRKDRID